jgi:hypothetical protein
MRPATLLAVGLAIALLAAPAAPQDPPPAPAQPAQAAAAPPDLGAEPLPPDADTASTADPQPAADPQPTTGPRPTADPLQPPGPPARPPRPDPRRSGQDSALGRAALPRLSPGPESAGGLARVPGARYGGGPEGAGAALAVPGSPSGQAVVAIDGFEVAGDARSGAAGFGLLAAELVEVTPSGFEPDAAMPGVRLNLVQQRGTNEWRGAASSLWGGLLGRRGTLGSPAVPAAQAQSGEPLDLNRLRGSSAYGLEAGGLLHPDRLWLWGAADRSAERWTVFGGQRRNDTLRRAAAKLNARLSDGNSALLAWNGGWQSAAGEGAGPERGTATTLGGSSRSGVARLEDTHIFSPASYLTANLGVTSLTARDDSRGGLGRELWFDGAGVAHGSWFAQEDRRRRWSAAAAGERFFSTGNLRHEVKLGGEDRQEAGEAAVTAPGSGAVLTPGQVALLSPDVSVVQAWREGRVATRLDRQAVWLQDRIARGPATAVVGLRYDLQRLALRPSRAAASPFTPLLPAVDFSGSGGAVTGLRWQSFTPRLGVSWALGKDREALLRASLARYAAPLDPALGAQLDPTAPASAYYYFANPLHDVLPPPTSAGLGFWVPAGFDPLRPGATPNTVDPALHPEMTDEAVLGFEIAPLQGSILSLTGTYRRVGGVMEQRLLVRDGSTGQVRLAQAADWVPAGAVAGRLPAGSYYQPYYDLRPGLEPTGGTLLTNGDRRQRYAGLTLGWTRRLANRWTARAHLTWQDWSWRIGPNFRHFADPTAIVGAGQRDGAPVVTPAAGFGEKPFFLNSRWSWNASALAQLPWGVNAALQLDGRQGFPVPYFQQVGRDAAGPIDVQAVDRLDRFRYGSILTADARLDREIALRGELDLTLALEGLNLLAAGTVLRREADLGVTRAGFVNEALAPRTVRLGVKLAFR